jgi:hypothetical protein
VAQVVQGLKEAKKVLNKIDPTLYKEMNAKITDAMREVRDIARREVPDTIMGLRNFQDTGKERKSRTSRSRAFPMYDPALVRKGLTYSIGAKKPTSSGFRALYSMLNSNAAGAIVETAGRLNPAGSYESQSNNRGAGAHFINMLNGSFGLLQRAGTGRTSEGRLLGGVLAIRQRALQDSILKSIDEAIKTLQVEVDKK